MKKYFSKKHIVYVFSLILFCFLLYGIINILNKNKENFGENITVSASPITNKIVVLDAGHGLPDEGATGFNGTSEQAINLSIVLKLQRIIEQSGAKVVLTRSNENAIYSADAKSIRNKKVSDSKNRIEIINNSYGDILVSIHLNKFVGSSKYSGWQCFYQNNNEESKKLANFIQENLNNNISNDNKRTTMSIQSVYLMQHSQIPSVIVECGFLSNEEECSKLKEDNYQEKLAWGIFMGIQNYFNN